MLRLRILRQHQRLQLRDLAGWSGGEARPTRQFHVHALSMTADAVGKHGVVDVEVLLRAEREQTLAQIDALAADLADIKLSSELVATDDEHDPEGATIAFERARLDALLTQARGHLVAITQAEHRVADGTYGGCERCGKPVSEERLAARPTAATCIDCAAT